MESIQAILIQYHDHWHGWYVPFLGQALEYQKHCDVFVVIIVILYDSFMLSFLLFFTQDNLVIFLNICRYMGMKKSQLFHVSDLAAVRNQEIPLKM